MSTASPVVQVSSLRRSYGAFEALKGVSFAIRPGEIVGLLGPNGAGKTTTMKILTGFLAPTGGTAEVCGHDALIEPIEVQKRLGYLPENAPVYGEMSVRSYLQFVGQVRGLGAAERASAIARTADQCGLSDRLDQRIGTLSRGYRQRVGLAQALLHEPPLLILDEPTTGLDPNQIVEIRSLIREVGATRTVILSTHILPEVQVTCDRVLIIHQGELVADGAVDDVVSSTSGFTITLGLAAGKVRAQPDTLKAQLTALDGVQRVTVAAPGPNELHRFVLHATEDLRPELFRWVVDKGLVLVELSSASSNLEEVFRRLTQAEGDA